MRIERLDEGAWQRLRTVRLAALREAPDAFGSTYETCVTWPEARWREQLRTLATFVAVAGDADVGMVRGAAHAEIPSAAILISMWVDPVARRRGAGAALVDAVIAWARDCGKTELHLDVREQNAAAVGLYERCGFRPTGRVEPDGAFIERSYVLDLSP